MGDAPGGGIIIWPPEHAPEGLPGIINAMQPGDMGKPPPLKRTKIGSRLPQTHMKTSGLLETHHIYTPPPYLANHTEMQSKENNIQKRNKKQQKPPYPPPSQEKDA